MMLKAYLAAVPSLYEGEDITVIYSVFQEDVCVKKNNLSLEYVKPALVGQASVLALLLGLQRYKRQEIVAYINDTALYQLLRGNSIPQNTEVLRMAGRIQKQLEKYSHLSFLDVTNDKAAFLEWKKRLEE